jgi:hypothetical protein
MFAEGARKRKRTLAGTLIAGLAVLALQAGTASAASGSTAPLEGAFESCPLQTDFQTCTQRLAVMRRGGLRVVVMEVRGSSPAVLEDYAAAAHGLGMSVMWDIATQDWWQQPLTSGAALSDFPLFATACGCSDDAQLLAYVVQQLGSQPGTYGYYAADDSMLGPGDQAGMAAYVDTIKQNDPGHTVMISAYSSSESQEYMGIADLTAQEEYPVRTQPALSAGNLAGVAHSASETQQAADHAGKGSAFILQAFTWGDNVDDGQAVGVCTSTDTQASCYAKLLYPTRAEQLALRNAVLLNADPKLILWWSFQGTYGNPAPDSFSVFPTGAVAAARWAGLSAAITAPIPRRYPRSRRRRSRDPSRR